MSRRIDLIGEIFGRLTVVCLDEVRSTRKSYWKCKCECGSMKSVRSDRLKSGGTLSCGCLKKEQDRINLTKNHSHKMTGTRLYSIWQGMKDRCYNFHNSRFYNYGGRGIKVCKSWASDFTPFMEWALSNGYDDSLQIDRIDNDGNYEPDNCRWSTIEEQCNNRRSNIMIKHKGEHHTLTKVSKMIGIDANTLHRRYKAGDRGGELLRPLGVSVRDVRGAKNIHNKISESQAREIKRRLSLGHKPIEIYREMNISKNIVYDINRGKAWAWL